MNNSTRTTSGTPQDPLLEREIASRGYIGTELALSHLSSWPDANPMLALFGALLASLSLTPVSQSIGPDRIRFTIAINYLWRTKGRSWSVASIDPVDCDILRFATVELRVHACHAVPR